MSEALRSLEHAARAADSVAAPAQLNLEAELARAAAAHPECEVLFYRDRTARAHWPDGFVATLLVPRARIAERVAKGLPAPLWRHGEVIDAREVGCVWPPLDAPARAVS